MTASVSGTSTGDRVQSSWTLNTDMRSKNLKSGHIKLVLQATIEEKTQLGLDSGF